MSHERKSPAFPMYGKDWLASEDITLMPPEAEGLFIRLLMIAWDNGGLPTESEAVKRLAGVKYARCWKKAWPPVRRKFVERGGRLVNARQEAERQKQADFRALQTQKSKLAAEARKAPTGAVRDNPDHTHGSIHGPPRAGTPLQFASASALAESTTSVASQPAAPSGNHTAEAAPPGEPNAYGVLFPLIREYLWLPDKKPPTEIKGEPWSEKREGTVIRELLRSYSVSDLEVVIMGLGNMVRGLAEEERPSWLPLGAKGSLRAVFHTRSGVTQMVELCRRAYWSVANKKPKRGDGRVPSVGKVLGLA